MRIVRLILRRRTAHLEASSSSLSTLPSHSIISAGDLMAIAGSSLIFFALVVCLVESITIRYPRDGLNL